MKNNRTEIDFILKDTKPTLEHVIIQKQSWNIYIYTHMITDQAFQSNKILML